jgi:N-acetylglucosaminyldiphosphoundecaprenol N-acetyl-beta-D-mannosaminyltransferase
LVVAESDPEFSRAIRDADLTVPDGSGILIASQLLGRGIEERITGSDVFQELSQALNKEGGKKYFFLGSTDCTLNAIREKMALDYPGIEIAGTYSPPFTAEFSEEDNRSMVDAVNRVKPDVLWVGMTAPKQEKWIYRNRGQLDVKFIAAVGAVFDFYTGNVKRSHPFFQKVGLEWLPRLVREPRRLWRRNFVSSPLFLCRIIRSKFSS